MHRALGLSRDPFAAACDGDLYWESPARAEARQEITRLLDSCRGVWLRGEPGSGRETLVGRAVEPLALGGRCVAWCPGPETPEGLLPALGEVTGAGGAADAGGLGLTAEVYERLVDGFCRAGPVIVALPGDRLAAGDPEEMEILASLRLLGKPLVSLALWGEGPAPIPTLQEISLPPLSPAEIRAFLAHRLAACGGTGDLDGALDRVGSDAPGLGRALELGRREFARLVFRSAGDPALLAAGAPPPRSTPVLDPEELDEVGRLLGGLGPENPSP